MDDYSEIELDAAQQELLANLSREREPDAAVEERLVLALRRAGKLGPRQWYRRSVPVPLAAAAGFLLFAAGAVAGQRLAHRDDATAGAERAGPAPAAQEAGAPQNGGLVIQM